MIDDAGEEPMTATEMTKMRRQMREAAAAAERDSEPNPEELEKYIKERFGANRGCVGAACTCGCACGCAQQGGTVLLRKLAVRAAVWL